MQEAADHEGLPCVMHAEDAVQTVTTTCAGCLLNARAPPYCMCLPLSCAARRYPACLSLCCYLFESLPLPV